MTGPNPAKKFPEIALKKGLILHEIGDCWANCESFFVCFLLIFELDRDTSREHFLGHKRVCDWSKSGDENARKLDQIPGFFSLMEYLINLK